MDKITRGSIITFWHGYFQSIAIIDFHSDNVEILKMRVQIWNVLKDSLSVVSR